MALSTLATPANTAPEPSGMAVGERLFVVQQGRVRHLDRGRRRGPLPAPKREKAALVRKSRACLVCKMLKIPCSGSRNEPCEACLKQALSKKLQSNVLPWRYCIRTSFEELNIFSAATRGHRMDVAVALRPSPSRSNAFKRSKQDLSLDSIVQDVVDVLKLHGASINSGVQLEAGHQSFLKLLFSPQFEKLLVPALDRELGSCFDSIRRSAPLPRHIAAAAAAAADDATRLHVDYHERGSLMLRRFDRLLTPQALAKLPRDMLQSIYLLMIGLVLTTSLMLTSGNSPLRPPSPSGPPPTAAGGGGGGGVVDEQDDMWLAMHQHVSEMTMHYIILLGARIDARIPTHYHEALITQGARAWTESERRLGVDFILRWPAGASPLEMNDAVASARVIEEAVEAPCGSNHERNVGHGHVHAPPALEASQLPHRPNPACC